MNDFPLELDEMVYALDSTIIDLCLGLFPWAKFRKHKGAVKLHALLDLRGSIPIFIDITEGLTHDVNVLDLLIKEISCRMDYSSAAHLPNHFRKMTGFIPAYYKGIANKRRRNSEDL